MSEEASGAMWAMPEGRSFADDAEAYRARWLAAGQVLCEGVDRLKPETRARIERGVAKHGHVLAGDEILVVRKSRSLGRSTDFVSSLALVLPGASADEAHAAASAVMERFTIAGGGPTGPDELVSFLRAANEARVQWGCSLRSAAASIADAVIEMDRKERGEPVGFMSSPVGFPLSLAAALMVGTAAPSEGIEHAPLKVSVAPQFKARRARRAAQRRQSKLSRPW